MATSDIIIRGGTVVDGTGAEPYQADVAIRDGVIAAVGQNLGSAREEIDATGCIVTPGFVDIHTHYDGQAIWSDRMEPSSNHGVTTVVMGNCGVGFAPCRAEDHDLLITVMEGVEDIPGVVMNAGLSWNWETFPEYLNEVDKRPRDIDVAAYLPHSPLRVYVMGKRGAEREEATAEDLAKMRAIAKEAIEAGALGCATSRVFIHRTSDGKYIPTYRSSEAELQNLADGMTDAGGGIMQMVGNTPEDGWEHDVRMMERITTASGRPFTFTMGAHTDSHDVMKVLREANDGGAKLTGQIFPRPVGMILAHNLSWNPFTFCPSFAPLAALSDEDRLVELRKPEVRARLVSEEADLQIPLAKSTRDFTRMFPLGDPPNYEPTPEDSVAARAAREGVDPFEWAYDYLLQNDGKAQLLLSLGNFVNGSLDLLREMMDHPNLIFGLGDGGAHYGLICDASFPTHILTHWVRDRGRGLLPLSQAVATLTRRPAETVGLYDRGVLAPGYKADVNVIDTAKLALHAPTAVRDLPGGGRRLMQKASGYRASIVSGRTISRDGVPTGDLPGRLVRGAQAAPVAMAAE
ncbi:N-acyl-D-amino-acid deacylase family protein [Sphingomonas crocodyli]|uniref:D-aminoacylase n=1 Tax=Sphingomonas crocodyli TaxID=1979270 RepID=A0A437MA84_9SPHN|nr:amidohydrolase family protein [Sphingomonas crocodyli]RVT94544.1 D-aminoacylase [Sphingomonas crocodyli]